MTVLFFVYLAVLQVILGVASWGAAAAVASIPSLRPHRARLIGGATWGSAGGFLGALAGFACVVLIGVAWMGLRYGHVVPDSEVSEHIFWVFPLGYVGGIAGGAILGWRRGTERTDEL